MEVNKYISNHPGLTSDDLGWLNIFAKKVHGGFAIQFYDMKQDIGKQILGRMDLRSVEGALSDTGDFIGIGDVITSSAEIEKNVRVGGCCASCRSMPCQNGSYVRVNSVEQMLNILAEANCKKRTI